MPRKTTIAYTPGTGAQMSFSSTASTPPSTAFPDANAELGGFSQTTVLVPVPAFTGFEQVQFLAPLTGLPQRIQVPIGYTGTIIVTVNVLTLTTIIIGVPSIGLSFGAAATTFPSYTVLVSGGVYLSPVIYGYLSLYSGSASAATQIELQVSAVLLANTS